MSITELMHRFIGKWIIRFYPLIIYQLKDTHHTPSDCPEENRNEPVKRGSAILFLLIDEGSG